MIDIFLSYAHEDYERILPLVKKLEEQDWKVWSDTNIETGVQFDKEIEAAIESARCIVVIWSEHSIVSEWVRSEAHEGHDRQILVPVLLDDVRPPLPFRQIQSFSLVDKSQFSEADLEGLFDAIRQTLDMNGTGNRVTQTTAKQALKTRRTSIPGFSILGFIIVFVGLISFIALDRFSLFDPIHPQTVDQARGSYAQENTIAVLPFVNLSDDSSNDYFSDGVAEEILNSLAAIQNLKVIARSSSFSLRGQNLDIPAIGQRLNVRNLIEGSVRRQGNMVRISARLINAVDGSQIWTSTYDRTIGDIFTVQEEISRAIVSSLKLALTSNEEDLFGTLRSVDFAAYDLYLLGRHHAYKRNVASIETSIKLFKQSIELDPDFVLAYTGLADAYNLLVTYGSLSNQEAAALMEPIIETAIELNDDLPEVQTSLGAMRGIKGLIDQEEQAYRKAIEINSNYSLAYVWLGHNLLMQNQLTEGIDVFEQALVLDPLNPAVILNLARVELYLGRFDKAEKYLQLVESLVPDSSVLFQLKAWGLREYGFLDRSLTAAKKAVSLDPEGVQILGAIVYSEMALGNFDAADYWIEQASQLALDNWLVVWLKSESYYLRGRYEAFDAYAEERLSIALSGESFSVRDLKTAYVWAGMAKLVVGDYHKAAEYLDAAYSETLKYGFEPPQELEFMSYRILAHRQDGNEATAFALQTEALSYLANAMSQGWRSPGFLVSVASIYIVCNDRKTALDYLQQAFDGGFRNLQFLQNNPVLQKLRGDEKFDRLSDLIEQDIERMQAVIGRQ